MKRCGLATGTVDWRSNLTQVTSLIKDWGCPAETTVGQRKLLDSDFSAGRVAAERRIPDAHVLISKGESGVACCRPSPSNVEAGYAVPGPVRVAHTQLATGRFQSDVSRSRAERFSLRIRLRSVVLPAPRKPVSTVTGTRVSSMVARCSQ
jgi:hypothetical protein